MLRATRRATRVLSPSILSHTPLLSSPCSLCSLILLQLRDHVDGRGGVYVEGAVWQPVASPEDLCSAITRALATRVTAQTAQNAVSSRSHAVVMLAVEQTMKHGPHCAAFDDALRARARSCGGPSETSLPACDCLSSGLVSHLHSELAIVDLAGSEVSVPLGR